MSRGIIIAAPGSGSGKTTLTLAMLRWLRDAGISVASGKVGPDYIDPAYHAAASGRTCHNLDTWSMSDGTLSGLIADLQRDSAVVVVEGVMGLFDGAPDGCGSAADLSRRTGWPVVLVVDASGMAASVAALVHGFASFDPGVEVAGVIFNRTGSARHGALLRRAIRRTGIPVLGCVTRSECLVLPDRHLGLVQAREHPDLEGFLARAAAQVGAEVDTGALLAAAQPARIAPSEDGPGPPVFGGLPLLGRRIAVARDDAFAFCYPYVLDGWRRAGCELCFFSPLADESPADDADAVYLPGGYPELHAARLAAAGRFKSGLVRGAARGAVVYGECGGYMVLGERLVDGTGVSHRMVGLLPVATSFESPRLSLGYREVVLTEDGGLGSSGTRFRGHEFHFASVLTEVRGAPLFRTFNAELEPLGDAGLRVDRVMGSFVHLMDRCGG
ncbi:MAG: cobyrinate a,c-diamide synthase [Thiotrichales bacterium]|nr:cobyrinate a,c-diamide synthase [Thiotrichales bacterium]